MKQAHARLHEADSKRKKTKLPRLAHQSTHTDYLWVTHLPLALRSDSKVMIRDVCHVLPQKNYHECHYNGVDFLFCKTWKLITPSRQKLPGASTCNRLSTFHMRSSAYSARMNNLNDPRKGIYKQRVYHLPPTLDSKNLPVPQNCGKRYSNKR